MYLHFLLLYFVLHLEPLENFTSIFIYFLFFLGCVLLALLYILLPPRFAH